MVEHEPQPNGNFSELVNDQFGAERFICVALDPFREKIEAHTDYRLGTVQGRFGTLINFHRDNIEATIDTANTYKLDEPLHKRFGFGGISAMVHIAHHLKQYHGDRAVILDGKYSGTPDEMLANAEWAFDEVGADAITVSPYTGYKALMPVFQEEKWSGKGILILTTTSNPGSKHPQRAVVSRRGINPPWQYLYQLVAEEVKKNWADNPNVGVVAAANHERALKNIRSEVKNKLILSPGVETQGGDVNDLLRFGQANDSFGVLVVAGRGILYPEEAVVIDRHYNYDHFELVYLAAQRLHAKIKNSPLRIPT